MVRSPASNFASAGRHPDRFRQTLGRYTEAHRQVPAWVNSQLRAIERCAGRDIRHDREPAHLGGQFGSDIRYRRVVLAGDDEFDVSLSIIVDEPIADVRNVGEVAADRLFELLLRERSLRFRHVVDGQPGPADVDGAVRNSSAVDEDARHLGPLPHAIDDDIGHRLGVGELRAGRQFDAEHRAGSVGDR
jgi:hypothetical protein